MGAATYHAARTSDGRAPRARAALTEAHRDLDATVASVRAAADEIGRRMPDLIDSARTTAVEGTRLVESWPEPTRRLVASFSIGLGTGLFIAGAPRILVAGALLPAVAVAASGIQQEPLTPDPPERNAA